MVWRRLWRERSHHDTPTLFVDPLCRGEGGVRRVLTSAFGVGFHISLHSTHFSKQKLFGVMSLCMPFQAHSASLLSSCQRMTFGRMACVKVPADIVKK
jgi:hypothetical protein